MGAGGRKIQPGPGADLRIRAGGGGSGQEFFKRGGGGVGYKSVGIFIY